MKLWLDAQLPPALAAWITVTFGIDTQSVRDLGLRGAKDPQIFQAARDAETVVMTKDSDFVELVDIGFATTSSVDNLWKHNERSAEADSGQVFSTCHSIASARRTSS